MAREAITDSSAVPSVASGKAPDRLLDASLLSVLLFSSLVFYCVSTQGTLSPLHQQTLFGGPGGPEGRFFLAQTQAMVHGRLWINSSQLPSDCFVAGGKCYGYFGITPSLLRLPFLPLLDHFNSGFTPVFITAGLTLATGSFLALLRHLFSHLCVRRSTTVAGCPRRSGPWSGKRSDATVSGKHLRRGDRMGCWILVTRCVLLHPLVGDTAAVDICGPCSQPCHGC